MSTSRVDRHILSIAARFYRLPGSRDAAAYAELGLTPTRYAAALNRVIDDPQALAQDPVTVNRLRRQRAARMVARGHGT